MTTVVTSENGRTTVQLPREFVGHVRRGDVVRLYGSQCGASLSDATGGDAVAVLLYGYIRGILIPDGQDVQVGGAMPNAIFTPIVPGVMDAVSFNAAGEPVGGRVVDIDRERGTFTWGVHLAPNILAPTAEEIETRISALETRIPGIVDERFDERIETAVEGLQTIKDLRDELADNDDAISAIMSALDKKQPLSPALSSLSPLSISLYAQGILERADAAGIRQYIGAAAAGDYATNTALATKQDKSANLDQLSALALQALGLSLLTKGTPQEVRDAIGAQAVIAAGSYATPADVKAADDALFAKIMGGMVPEEYNSFLEILNRIINDENTVAQLTTALAGKQPLSSVLTTLAGTNPSALGLQLLQASTAAAARTALGAQAASDILTGLSGLALTASRVFGTDANGAVAQLPYGVAGKGLIALDKPVLGAVPITTDANGTVGVVATSLYIRNLLKSAPPAQSLIGTGAGRDDLFNSIPWGTAGAKVLAGESVTAMRQAVGQTMRFLSTQTSLAIPSASATETILPSLTILGSNPSALADHTLITAGTATKTVSHSLQYFVANRFMLRLTVSGPCDLIISFVSYGSNGSDAGGAGNVAAGSLGFGMAYGSRGTRRLTVDRAGVYDVGPTHPIGCIAGGWTNVLIVSAGNAVNITQATLCVESVSYL